MARKTPRAHVWRQSVAKGKLYQYCEACGKDKPNDALKAAVKDCRPTSIF